MILSEEEKKELPYTVFRRGDSGSYGLRFTLVDKDGKTTPQFRIGLGKCSEEEAYAKAAKEYERAAIRNEEGLSVGPARFHKVAQSYVRQLLSEGKSSKRKYGHARHAQGCVERYFIPFFKQSSIGAIGPAKIKEYMEWRKSYWITGPGKDIDEEEHVRGESKVRMRFQKIVPSDATLKREANFLRGVFNHAVDKNYIKESDVPKISFGNVQTNRRPALTKEEYKSLEQVAIQRYMDACNSEITAINKKERQQQLATKDKLIFERKQMVEFIYIAVQTGMRPGELFNLNWGHIDGLDTAPLDEFGDRNIRIFAHGKNKKGNLIPAAHTSNAFLQLKEAYKTRFGTYPKDEDPVFCDAVGNRLVSLNKPLNQLLKAAGLLHNSAGEKISTYCFRHTYATWQLQKSDAVDIYTLAINMRTSVEMIENYYSKLIASLHQNLCKQVV